MVLSNFVKTLKKVLLGPRDRKGVWSSIRGSEGAKALKEKRVGFIRAVVVLKKKWQSDDQLPT